MRSGPAKQSRCVLAVAQRHHITSCRDTDDQHRRFDANGYVCQGEPVVFNIHIASLDAQAKAAISNISTVSARLGIGAERLRVGRWIISAKLRLAPLRLGFAACGGRRGTRQASQHDVTAGYESVLVCRQGAIVMMIRGASVDRTLYNGRCRDQLVRYFCDSAHQWSPASGRSASAWRAFSVHGGQHRRSAQGRMQAEGRGLA